MRRLFVLSLLVGLLGMAAPAEAKHFRYLSGHPFHGGFCTMRGPHAHKYGPTDVRLYRVVRGDYYFVGDPVPFGYGGPTFAYYGAHPVFEATVNFGEPVYCYLDGPHYHWYAPPPQTHFEVRSGVNWYVGGFEPIYFEHRPRYVVVNEVYRPIHYQRPRAVVTDAPTGWRGTPPPPAGWRGSPPPASGGWRGTPPATVAPAPAGGGWRGTPPASAPAPSAAPPPAGGWRGSRQPVVVAPAGAQPAPAPAFGTPPPSRGPETARGRDKRDHDGDDRGRGHDKHDGDHGDRGRGHHKGKD